MSQFDQFRRVSPGDPLRIQAAVWNRLLDLARETSDVRGPGFAAGAARLETGMIYVRNETEADIPRFGACALGEPIFPPGGDPQAFVQGVSMRGVVPDFREHWGRFAVAQDPIADGRVGRCMVSGVTIARVWFPANSVASQSMHYADIIDGETGHLGAGQCGSARVIWSELDESAGERWAIIDIGGGSARQEWLAQLGSSTSYGTRKWRYEWQEVRPSYGPNVFETITNGRDHTVYGYGYVPMESGASGSGVQPGGWNSSNLVGTFDAVPIGPGAIVQMRGPFGSTPYCLITGFGSTDGTCEEPE